MHPSSLKGQLLLSDPRLRDPDFRHTVVLVGEHNEEGALGVVLNRPMRLTVGEGFPALVPLLGGEGILHRGGPVQPEGAVLVGEFTDPVHADIPVFGRVGFLVGDVEPSVRPHLQRARLFAGYAGWGPGQLEGELAGGGWIVHPARADDVFTEAPEGLWHEVMRRMGPDFERMARVPHDPRVN